jgi:hypothetical protein
MFTRRAFPVAGAVMRSGAAASRLEPDGIQAIRWPAFIAEVAEPGLVEVDLQAMRRSNGRIG